MFKNQFIIAWRILLRQKVFSAINILGLALGMAACLLILQYISFELSFDNFHRQGENIYRLEHQNYSDGALIENLPETYAAVGPTLLAAFPEVKQETRIATDDGLVSAAQPNGSLVAFNETNIYYVDSSFLHFFTFPMKEGPAAALSQPNAVVITEKTAKKYFPHQDALGKTLIIQEQTSGTNISATVTGVCEDIPVNSHLQFNFLVSTDMGTGDWVTPQYYTYIRLARGASATAFQTRLGAYLASHIAELSQNKSFSNTQGKSKLAGLKLKLLPLHDIHLYSNLPGELTPGGNGRMVWFLGFIAFTILLIAYVNYLNLSTAKVIERAKEVGIRKVLGSQRWQLIKQFLFESLIINTISLGVAAAIVCCCMPWFSSLCGVEMDFTLWKNAAVAPAFLGLMILGIALSALYPAMVLSAYKPVQILKGKFLNNPKSITLRKALVVFQFTATVACMAGTLTVYRQLHYMQTENRGMDMTQTLVVVAPKNIRATDQEAREYAHKDTVFQTEVLRIPRVRSVTTSSSIPGQSIGYIMSYTSHGETTAQKNLRLATMEIGSGFIRQFHVKVVAGDSLGADAWSRRYPVLLLNESAVAALGFKNPEDAVGKLIETRNGRGKIFQNEVIGVTENFHQSSLKEGFTPLVFRLSDPNSTSHYELKIQGANLAGIIAEVEKTFKTVFPASAFEHFFLDDYFNRQYQTEQHFGEVFRLFAVFAVLVACMGLFGLTIITMNQRVKEIGIRKVLGASTPGILALIIRDFISLVLIANIIALPLTYWGGKRWLQEYAFRVSLSWWQFVVPMITVCLLALLTVSYQALKTAGTNPVTSLRAE